jgi:hypothetical protein
MESSIGKILTGNEGRDAFHQPIIPLIIKGDSCAGGDWVKKVEGSKKEVCICTKNDKKCIGYIDPYIDGVSIPNGSKVYIFLNQGLIDNMRHHWSSPFFDEEDIASDITTTPISDTSKERLEAKQWLQDLCKQNRLDFSEFERATSISHIYEEIDTYVKLNTGQGEYYLEESVLEIYKKFALYKNIEFNEETNADDIYYIDWNCMGCD